MEIKESKNIAGKVWEYLKESPWDQKLTWGSGIATLVAYSFGVAGDGLEKISQSIPNEYVANAIENVGVFCSNKGYAATLPLAIITNTLGFGSLLEERKRTERREMEDYVQREISKEITS